MLLQCSKDYLAVCSKERVFEASHNARAKAVLDGVCHCTHVMSVTKVSALGHAF